MILYKYMTFSLHEEVTNTQLLEPFDQLEVHLGDEVLARLEVLDSHDPSSGYIPNGSKSQRPPGSHHHILAQLPDSELIVPTGLWVGKGGSDLLFAHATNRHGRDPQLRRAMLDLQDRLHTDGARLVRVFGHGGLVLHTLDLSLPYLDSSGKLKR